MGVELSVKVQNHHLPKYIKKLICHQNATEAFAMLKNASMENVKLMRRNNHQSLNSNNQILTGTEKTKKLVILLPMLKQLKKLEKLQEVLLQKETPLHLLKLLKVLLLFLRKQLHPAQAVQQLKQFPLLSLLKMRTFKQLIQ